MTMPIILHDSPKNNNIVHFDTITGTDPVTHTIVMKLLLRPLKQTMGEWTD